MNLKDLIKIVFLSLMATSCFAKLLKLECSDNTNFVVQFDVDDVRKTVVSSGVNATSVFIDANQISFYLYTASNDINWFHTISRYSGNMTVQNSRTKTIVDSNFRCKAVSDTDRKF